MISEDWESLYSRVVQSLLPRPVLDHNPIYLDGNGLLKARFLSSLRICG